MPSVPDYLIWSIITTLCCCLPLGVVGIIFSVLGKTDLRNGDYNEAMKKSKIAFWCNLVGLISGLLIAVFYAMLAALGVLAEGM